MIINDWGIAYDWFTSLELVSLDFVRPVFGELGLKLDSPSGDVIRATARESLREMARTDKHDVELFYAQGVPRFLTTVARELGTDCRDRIVDWVRHTACTEECNPWIQCEAHIMTWASMFRRAGIDEVGFEQPTSILLRLEFERDLTAVARQLEDQRQKPLSDWDLPLFIRRGLLEIPKESDYYPWVDGILLVIEMARFQRFWSWLVGNTGTNERTSLTAFLTANSKDDARVRMTDLLGL